MTAAAIAAASSSVGTGVMEEMFVFIGEPPLNSRLGRAMFGVEGSTT
jgi:hypothetical protein